MTALDIGLMLDYWCLIGDLLWLACIVNIDREAIFKEEFYFFKGTMENHLFAFGCLFFGPIIFMLMGDSAEMDDI